MLDWELQRMEYRGTEPKCPVNRFYVGQPVQFESPGGEGWEPMETHLRQEDRGPADHVETIVWITWRRILPVS